MGAPAGKDLLMSELPRGGPWAEDPGDAPFLVQEWRPEQTDPTSAIARLAMSRHSRTYYVHTKRVSRQDVEFTIGAERLAEIELSAAKRLYPTHEDALRGLLAKIPEDVS